MPTEVAEGSHPMPVATRLWEQTHVAGPTATELTDGMTRLAQTRDKHSAN